MSFSPGDGHHPVMSSTEQLADPRDESVFAARFERHRQELQHWSRMLGSFEDGPVGY
jgi:hypothetical protein